MSNRPKNVAIHPYHLFYPIDLYHKNMVKQAQRLCPYGYNKRRIGTKCFRKILSILKIHNH